MAYLAHPFTRDTESKIMSDEQNTNPIGGIAADALKSAIDRIERLEEEKKALAADIKDVYAQAKSQGFDPKIIRQIVRLRKIESAEREEAEQLLDLYMAAIGMA
jgi:uncharacterized protein (UPF0335 family)